MGSSVKFKLSALGLALILACCSLAPAYEQPEAPSPGSFPLVSAATAEQRAADAEFSELGWEESFNDPQLKALIDVAPENNCDIRIAVDRVLEAQAQYAIARREQFPAGGGGGVGQGQAKPATS